jgi:hypothetical protein
VSKTPIRTWSDLLKLLVKPMKTCHTFLSWWRVRRLRLLILVPHAVAICIIIRNTSWEPSRLSHNFLHLWNSNAHYGTLQMQMDSLQIPVSCINPILILSSHLRLGLPNFPFRYRICNYENAFIITQLHAECPAALGFFYFISQKSLVTWRT